ncbi:hypothetical protein [Paenibacillus sp. IHBB 10380]|uniref:hypothetical protein n=1 Tax=Paenibacillus sp. IHBB 10380 TaxID=1566358 RepID=UPI0006971F6C|nr:hypothetical protein [Paenibacillus sp. IHBB 10380]
MKSKITLILSCTVPYLIASSIGMATSTAHAVQSTAHIVSMPIIKPDHHHQHGKHYGILKDAATLLGLKRQDLIREWKAGKTLAQIAVATKGWDEQTFTQKLSDKQIQNIDQEVNSGKITLEEGNRMKSNLPKYIKKALQYTHKNHHERQQGSFSHI